jgi:hypothetical protein
MANPPTLSELRFEAYLAAHGFIGDHDVAWPSRFAVDTDKKPDYLVSRAREELAICEVKEFTTSKINRRLELAGCSTSGGDELYGEAADAVQEACVQLRPFAGVGLPLVAVLVNPHGCIVDLSPRGLTFALFGTTQAVVIPVGPGGQTGAASVIATGRGALHLDRASEPRNPHPYLAAVVVVHARSNAQDFIDAELARRAARTHPPRNREERVARAVANLEALNAAERAGRFPPGSYEWVTAFDLSGHPHFTGTALGPRVFDGHRDRWYELGPVGVFNERDRGITAA